MSCMLADGVCYAPSGQREKKDQWLIRIRKKGERESNDKFRVHA